MKSKSKEYFISLPNNEEIPAGKKKAIDIFQEMVKAEYGLSERDLNYFYFDKINNKYSLKLLFIPKNVEKLESINAKKFVIFEMINSEIQSILKLNDDLNKQAKYISDLIHNTDSNARETIQSKLSTVLDSPGQLDKLTDAILQDCQFNSFKYTILNPTKQSSLMCVNLNGIYIRSLDSPFNIENCLCWSEIESIKLKKQKLQFCKIDKQMTEIPCVSKKTAQKAHLYLCKCLIFIKESGNVSPLMFQPAPASINPFVRFASQIRKSFGRGKAREKALTTEKTSTLPGTSRQVCGDPRNSNTLPARHEVSGESPQKSAAGDNISSPSRGQPPESIVSTDETQEQPLSLFEPSLKTNSTYEVSLGSQSSLKHNANAYNDALPPNQQQHQQQQQQQYHSQQYRSSQSPSSISSSSQHHNQQQQQHQQQQQRQRVILCSTPTSADAIIDTAHVSQESAAVHNNDASAHGGSTAGAQIVLQLDDHFSVNTTSTYEVHLDNNSINGLSPIDQPNYDRDPSVPPPGPPAPPTNIVSSFGHELPLVTSVQHVPNKQSRPPPPPQRFEETTVMSVAAPVAPAQNIDNVDDLSTPLVINFIKITDPDVCTNIPIDIAEETQLTSAEPLKINDQKQEVLLPEEEAVVKPISVVEELAQPNCNSQNLNEDRANDMTINESIEPDKSILKITPCSTDQTVISQKLESKLPRKTSIPSPKIARPSRIPAVSGGAADSTPSSIYPRSPSDKENYNGIDLTASTNLTNSSGGGSGNAEVGRGSSGIPVNFQRFQQQQETVQSKTTITSVAKVGGNIVKKSTITTHTRINNDGQTTHESTNGIEDAATHVQQCNNNATTHGHIANNNTSAIGPTITTGIPPPKNYRTSTSTTTITSTVKSNVDSPPLKSRIPSINNANAASPPTSKIPTSGIPRRSSTAPTSHQPTTP